MSDDDNENLDPNALGDDGQPNWRRKLEADAKAGRDAQKALAEEMAKSKGIQQELAMRRAGIDVDSPLAKMFAKANPELLDVDTITQQWGEISGTAKPGVDPADLSALQQIGGAASGGASSGGQAPDFEAELDAIPMLINDKLNPNYVNEVLQKTAEQASREGRQFSANGSGTAKWMQGNASTPATTPLKH